MRYRYVVLMLVVWVPVVIGEEAPGADARHPLRYFDSLYAGILALCDGELDEAAACFGQAAASGLGVEQLQDWRQRIQRLAGMTPKEAAADPDLEQIAQSHEVVRYCFLAEVLRGNGERPDGEKIKWLTFLINLKLASPPWDVPGDVVNVLHFRRAEARRRMYADKDGDFVVAKDSPDFELMKSDYEALHGVCSFAVIKGSPHSEASRNLALMHFGARDYKGALARCQSILERTPYLPCRDEILCTQGKCLVMVNRYADGMTVFARLLREHPTSPLAKDRLLGHHRIRRPRP